MIGSQKFVPLVSGTTKLSAEVLTIALWLALKSLYLWYLEQRLVQQQVYKGVVIGSQKFVPLVSGTTLSLVLAYLELLWLALKSLYLWYLEQLISS